MGEYRDLQLVVRHAGISCELQLSTELMLQAKATTGHRDYEVIRELKAATVAGDLGRVRARNHDYVSQNKFQSTKISMITIIQPLDSKLHSNSIGRKRPEIRA